MQTNTAPIYLINASAGSGKTYTLVQEYLFTVLGDPAPENLDRSWPSPLPTKPCTK